jgi:peptidoglycan/LPS O-acetylase OafA/YrhL
LDGLRGLAALQVVLGHYLQAFAPPAVKTVGFIADGGCAVNLFFLMSGMVLTPSFEQSPNAVVTGVARRVIRLGLPLAIAVSLALAAQTHLPDWTRAAAEFAGSTWLADHHVFWNSGSTAVEISGLTMLTGHSATTLFGFLAPFAPDLKESPDPPSWSLHLELWGSVLVLALVWARARSKRLHGAMVGVAIGLIGGNTLILFLIGHLSALFVRAPAFQRLITHRWVWLMVVPLLLTGIFMRDQHEIPGLWRTGQIALSLGVVRSYDWFSWPTELGSIMILGAILMSPMLQMLLAMRLPAWLGRLSFPVYLLHWPVMTVVGSMVFVLLSNLGQALAAIVALVVGLTLTMALATLFERWVDQPAIELSRAIGRKGNAVITLHR